MSEIIVDNSEDISIKELIHRVKVWGFYILNYWKIIIIVSFLGGIIGFFYASSQDPKYIAKTTFILEESKSNSSGLGNLASLAGQFGVDVGGGSSAGLLSGDNILLYFKSPSLAREVLLSNFNTTNNISIADEYAKVYDLKKDWSENKDIGSVNFPVAGQTIKYSRLQDSLLQVLVEAVLRENFNVARTEKKAGFIEVNVTMKNELLSKVYCESIVKRVVERYVNVKTQRQIATVQKLQQRADSIANLLRQKTLSGASLQNATNTMDINPLYRTGTSVAVESTIRDKTLLSTIFASVIQNLELAKFTLSQETPVIQIVDAPILPLKVEKISRIKTAFMGSLIFAFIVIVGIIFKRIYNGIIMS